MWQLNDLGRRLIDFSNDSLDSLFISTHFTDLQKKEKHLVVFVSSLFFPAKKPSSDYWIHVWEYQLSNSYKNWVPIRIDSQLYIYIFEVQIHNYIKQKKIQITKSFIIGSNIRLQKIEFFFIYLPTFPGGSY